MKAVVQRVKSAQVSVDLKTVGAISHGLLVLFCAERGDTTKEAEFFAHKIANMRIFSDANGKTNLSVRDVTGEILAVSQFTLAAEWRKGNRPGFSKAENPETAKQVFDHFCAQLRDQDMPVETGIFGADMDVALVNDGPFTIVMDGKT